MKINKIFGVHLVFGMSILLMQHTIGAGDCGAFITGYKNSIFTTPAACSNYTQSYQDSVANAQELIGIFRQDPSYDDVEGILCDAQNAAQLGALLQGVEDSYNTDGLNDQKNSLQEYKTILTSNTSKRGDDVINSLASVLITLQSMWTLKTFKVRWCLQQIYKGQYQCSLAACMGDPLSFSIRGNSVRSVGKKENISSNAVAKPNQNQVNTLKNSAIKNKSNQNLKIKITNLAV
jgi:hypothetical protein